VTRAAKKDAYLSSDQSIDLAREALESIARPGDKGA
jgi:hypothetical protein